ncbi:MAG: SpoIVB peptidase S55 domain-containing protein [Roseburia inulinivorans]
MRFPDPVKSVSGKYMLGVWVRDDLAGVGALTYYKKQSGTLCSTSGTWQ